MYVITFYSFKGGSGRSLALTNIGAELASTGRRVLLVDFDLEAPGLHTFPDLQPARPSLGVVDFVLDYQSAKQSPNVMSYLYPVPGIGGKGGQLWVMPAGRCDADYRTQLSRLNWKDLYEYHDGYLLIEDLKAQWNEELTPDYVLIDSRTGHSDSEGICTRQLPDSVAIFFMPNRQSLDGLEVIVSGIRSETKRTRRKNIQIHFVMSNVPNEDDDDLILSNLFRDFSQRLQFKALSGMITHHNSFAALDQQLFTLKKPRSRLSAAYRHVLAELIRDNTEDREVLIGDLRELAGLAPKQDRSPSRSLPDDQKLQKILSKYSRDVDVLHSLSLALRKQRRIPEALSVMDKVVAAAETGSDEAIPGMLVERAELHLIVGNKEGAVHDARRTLDCPSGTAMVALRAVRVLAEGDDTTLSVLTRAPLLQSLSAADLRTLLLELGGTRELLPISRKVLLSRIGHESQVAELNTFLTDLVLIAIGLGEFAEAIRLCDKASIPGTEAEISTVFNSAMAVWGQAGKPDVARFAEVLRLNKERPIQTPPPNYMQCMAVASWVTGDASAARSSLDRAITLVNESRIRAFSCWSYLWLPPDRFLKDCEKIGELVAGASIEPEFITATKRALYSVSA